MFSESPVSPIGKSILVDINQLSDYLQGFGVI